MFPLHLIHRDVVRGHRPRANASHTTDEGTP